MQRFLILGIFFFGPLTVTSWAVPIEHYIARRVAEATSVTTGYTAITGTAETGTVASTNGWIDNTNFTVGERYLILCWGFYNGSSTSGNYGLRVTHGGTSFTESESVVEPSQTLTTYKHPYFWFTVWTAANEDLEVQIYRGAAGGTGQVEDITLVAINAEALITDGDLQYNIDTVGGTLSTTLTTKTSVTWTPANNGDTWLVMSYGRFNVNAVTGDNYEQRLVLAGTNMTTAIQDGEDTTDTPIMPAAYARTFTNASTTIALQLRYALTSHAWLAAGIFALRLNAVESFIINATAGTQAMGAGDDLYNQLATATLVPRLTSNWIVTGGCIFDDNGAETTGRIQLNNVDITDEQGGQNWASTDQVPFIAADVLEYEARTSVGAWDLDGRETGNTTNPEGEDCWLAAFSLSTYDRTRRVETVNE